MNNRLHNGKVVVVFTTFYQFSLYMLMNLGFPVMPDHTALETRKYLLSKTWRFHWYCSATELCQQCHSWFVVLFWCHCPRYWGHTGSPALAPPQRSPVDGCAHGSCFCHYVLALWFLSPFSAGCWTRTCQLYCPALKGRWVWDMCDDVMVPWQQAVISSVPDGEFFQGHIRKNSCVVL